MTVWVFAHCRNERQLLPFWLRHYAAFAEQIHVFDDGSDDGSKAILGAHPLVIRHDITMGGLNESALMQLAYESIPLARGRADYIIWADLDEFVYHPRILECLARFKVSGYQVCRTLGFNMMGAELPEDDGKSQLWELYRTGVRAPIYSKPIVVDPSARVEWTLGKHRLESQTALSVTPEEDSLQPHPWRLQLLHYRHLTPEYCRIRNARQYNRSPDKGTAWSCAPEHTGEHSPAWVERVISDARDVVSAEGACYWETPIKYAE
jgi:hypothetical protein